MEINCNRVFMYFLPIPVAARSKAWVWGRWLARTAGSNSAGAWMFVCCECCVLSSRGLCDELITHPEESYRLWYVVCDLETSRMRRPWPALGRSDTRKKCTTKCHIYAVCFFKWWQRMCKSRRFRSQSDLPLRILLLWFWFLCTLKVWGRQRKGWNI